MPYSRKIWWVETLANLLQKDFGKKKLDLYWTNDLADFSLTKHNSLAKFAPNFPTVQYPYYPDTIQTTISCYQDACVIIILCWFLYKHKFLMLYSTSKTLHEHVHKMFL